MKIIQSTIQKTFSIEHKKKVYTVDYLNSDRQILGLINRNNWEIYEENGNELDLYSFKGDNEAKNRKVNKNWILAEKIIDYCIKHFEDYNPICDNFPLKKLGILMKVLKVKSRNYNGKQYYKFRVNLPSEDLKKAGFKEGDELALSSKKGEIRLSKEQT